MSFWDRYWCRVREWLRARKPVTWGLPLVACLVACSSSPPPAPPTIDAGAWDGDASDECGAACANLAALGCAEGIHPKCAPACRHARATDLVDLRPDCLVAARSKADVRLCGTVACP